MSGPQKGALIAAEGLSVALGGAEVLRGVDFHLNAGEIVTVVGPNGSGKTTLLRALIGAVAPSAGRIVRKPGLRVGYVPQKLTVDRAMPLTVDRFLALAGGTAAERRAALAQVGVPDLGGRQLAELSGGQTQRALLAHALLRRPEALALDEATQGLDQGGVAAFYRLIEALRRDLGLGVVMVSHDLHVVMRTSDRVVCLNGHVCCEGAPVVVSATPAYRTLFGLGADEAFAIYRHAHDHGHDHLADAPGAACAHGAPSALRDPALEDAR